MVHAAACRLFADRAALLCWFHARVAAGSACFSLRSIACGFFLLGSLTNKKQIRALQDKINSLMRRIV